MNRSRTLGLAKETLAELTPDELSRAGAGTFEATEPCNPCLFTWSCEDYKTLECLQTIKC